MKESQSSPTPDEPPSTGPQLPESLRCLQHAMEHRGCALSYAQTMGLSGEAFRIFFSGRDPARGALVVGHNPLRAVATALGFECTVRFAESVECALELIGADVGEQRGPALLLTDEGWLVVESRPTPHQWLCWHPEHGAVDRPSGYFAAHWPPRPGLLELGPLGWHFFSPGEQVRVSDPREAALGAMQRAYRQMLRQSKVEDCFGGLNAYHQISFVLERRRAAQSADDLVTYDRWHSAALPALTAARSAAALFLREVADLFPDDEEQECLFRAYRAYRQVAAAMAELPTFPEGAVRVLQAPAETAQHEARRAGVVSALWRDRWRIQKQVKQLWRLEKSAADALQRVVQAATRKGKG